MRSRDIAALAAAVVALGPPSAARAADFTVTKLTDSADGSCDADCSLREAVIASNAAAGADRIVLSAGTYLLSLAGPDENGALTGDLDVNDEVKIEGAGRDLTTIVGDGGDRVFHIGPTGPDITVTLSDLTITGGNVTTGGQDGGGIYAGGGVTRLALQRARVTGNTAGDAGGGIYVVADGSTVVDSLVDANTAVRGGGILASSNRITIERSLITGNEGTIQGGGLWAGGDLVVRNSTISDNLGAPELNSLGGSVSLEHATIARPGGFAISLGVNASLQVSNSLVVGGCGPAANITSLGGNVESPGSGCGFTEGDDQSSVAHADLELGVLADNGGPTETRALGSTSVAVDSARGASCLALDQRGIERPQQGGCDVGAFELALVCTDADEDGFYLEAECGLPVDCDDDDPAVNPDAVEIPANGIDDDCDPSTPVACNAGP